MNVTLHDSRASLPDNLRQHILVFTGLTDSLENEKPSIVTEVICTYCVGGQIVEYKKNSDARAQRFEEALGWAVHQAEIIGVTEIHAIFELSRPIDPRFLSRICPTGFIDLRRTIQISEVTYPSVPAWPCGELRKRAFSRSPLRRYYIFRNRNGKANGVSRATL